MLLNWIPGFGTAVGLLSLYGGIIYPTFQSFKAIESRSDTRDDTQWLTYWVVVCTLSIVERVAWPVLYWVPLYNLGRLLFLAWLAHPATMGATYLYESFIRPLLLATADALKDVSVLQPLVADFTVQAGRVSTKARVPAAQHPTSPDVDAVKQEAMQKVHETFEKAKQGQDEGYYQPLKAHAT